MACLAPRRGKGFNEGSVSLLTEPTEWIARDEGNGWASMKGQYLY